VCSRNDLAANVSVVLASLAVWGFASHWPDIIVGAIICALFLRSALVMAREALAELRVHHA
jgi:Co/Zn/Cd efflux system component